MAEILTTPKGTKFIQPELGEVCPGCKFYNFEYKAHWGETGYSQDKSKPIHTCIKNNCYLDNLAGCEQFEANSPSKTCRNCGNGKNDYYDSYCEILKQRVSSEKACPEFVEKNPGPSCRECHHFDSSVPENSPWQFCLLGGNYRLKYLDGCDKFKPIVPYSPSKKRRQHGDGSGNIQLHYYKSKKGKSYEQHYYHYEIRENGMRQRKGSRYIPKNKLDLIREMESNKKPVTAILYELGLTV